MKTTELQNRYPGIEPFKTEEKNLFFGRRNEIRKLYSLVKSKPIVVVFAKSGIGKSSLINAGLIPLLKKKYFQPIKIRLRDTNTSPVETVKQEISNFIDQDRLSQQLKNHHTASLWECMRACRFGTEEDPVTPVLIFDQFEEFFNHQEQHQAELTMEIADLISERLPLRIQEEFRKIPRKDRTTAQKNWYNPFELKVLIAIRSDRIHLMDNISDDIPTILHDRFHLKPMRHEQAREAIVAPASLTGYDFGTPPFSYGKNALNSILQFLSNKDDEIESFQLQLICQNIEKKVKENHG